MKRKILRNQRGFTLIEIIAVLVLLGILSAVAIPKYLDIASDARAKVLEGALAALQSTAVMDFSRGLLNSRYNSSQGPTDDSSVTVGDFTGGYKTVGGIITLTISNGPTNWDQLPAGTNKSKNIKLY